MAFKHCGCVWRMLTTKKMGRPLRRYVRVDDGCTEREGDREVATLAGMGVGVWRRRVAMFCSSARPARLRIENRSTIKNARWS
jgi:hypothetical protein